jgi:hypothetical protein
MIRKWWLVVSLLMLSLGCGGGSPAPSPPMSGKGGLARTIDKPKIEGYLRQIGTAYMLGETMGTPPKNDKELLDNLENNATIAKLLREETIIVVWNVHLLNVPDKSNTVLAYEKYPDAKGVRYVLMADASVVKGMTEQEFEKAAKAKGNP